jgi:hypothetical protein
MTLAELTAAEIAASVASGRTTCEAQVLEQARTLGHAAGIHGPARAPGRRAARRAAQCRPRALRRRTLGISRPSSSGVIRKWIGDSVR